MSTEEDDILESAIPAEIPGVLFQAIADDLMDEYKSFVPGPGRIKARRAAVRILGTLMAFYEQVEKEAKPMTQQTERDDALIAEVARAISRKVDSFGDTERTEQQRAELEWPRYREHAKAAIDLILARENWTPPAKADRYLQVWKEAKDAYIYPNRTEHESDQVAAAVLRRHFEPPSEVVEAARFYDAPGLGLPGKFRTGEKA